MQNAISNKIRLLLNELAILNQPDISGGKFIYNSEMLKQIKLLSSELYLLSDASLDDTLKVVVITPETPVAPPVVVAPEVVVSTPEPPPAVVEIVPEPVINIVEPELTNVSAPIEEVVQPAVVPEIVVPIVVEEVAVAPPVTIPSAPEIKEEVSSNNNASQRFDGKISITRKFEYTNNLFGGDGAAFASFLQNIAMSSGVSSALELFDREYDARNWKRKSESADDLKSLIKKSF